MEYKILSNYSMGGLSAEVNKLIIEGWKPQGGVCVKDNQYIQALVKKA